MAKEGHIFTEGQIGADYPELIAAQLARIGEVDKIVHHVSSPGGNVIGGYKGYHKLVDFGKPIDSIVEGEAQSMGSFILMASNATGGKIICKKPSRIMIHLPKFNVEGLSSSGYADSTQLQSGADELRTIENEMAEIYTDSAVRRGKKVSIEDTKAMMMKETYMSVEEAIERGFADEIQGNNIGKDIYEKLKAVALGKQSDNVMETKGVAAKLADVLDKAVKALRGESASAIDVPLKEGGILSVDGEVVQAGANASIDGAPANGEYISEQTGETIVCKDGVVTEVRPMAPQETEAQRLARENEELKSKLAQQTQSQEAARQVEQQKLAEETLKKAEVEKSKVAQALAKAEKEIEDLKKKTVGDKNKQFEGMEHNRTAFAIGNRTSDEAKSIAASRTWLADKMPHMERFYKNGKYSDGSSFFDYRRGGPMAVSVLETNFNYTYQGILSTDIFMKPTMDSPALSDIFTVDLGSKNNKRYSIGPTANKVLKPYTGCDQAVTGSNFNITSKNIQLKAFQMLEKWCVDDFDERLTGSFNILAEEWLKSGNDRFDPAGTPIDRLIMQILKDALRRDVFRRVSFGESGNSSADWNQIDGLLTTIINQSGASNYCVYRDTTATFGVGALGAGVAQNAFIAAYKNSDPILKQEGITKRRGEFLVTRSVWENYYDSLAATGAVTEQAFKNQVDGAPKLTFRGLPITPIDIWDAELNDAANPIAATTQNILLFTLKENNILGVEDTADLNNIKSWFSDDDNVRYYRSNMNYGVLSPIDCGLTTIVY